MEGRNAGRVLGLALPLLTGLSLGLWGASQDHPRTVVSSPVGPMSFDKYAFDGDNNPVDVNANVAHWDKAWTFTTVEPLQQMSMAKGVVYVTGDGGDLKKASDNRLYALDAGTGRLLWSRRLDNMSMTTPIVGNGLVFVGTGTQQFEGTNLSLENNLRSRHVVRGTGPSAIYGIDARTGQVAWQFRTRAEDMPSFVLAGRTLYAANGQGMVYAFHASSGTLKWALSIGSYVSMASLTMGPNQTLYVSGAHPYEIYKISTKSHRILAHTVLPHVFGGSDDSSPAYAHGRLYLEGTEGSWSHPESVLFAMNTTTGKMAFETRLDSGVLPTDIEVSAPVVSQNRVFVGSPITNTEYAENARTGKILWRFHAAGPISESAAVTSHALYVGDGRGFLYVLNPHTGQELGSRFLSGSLAADFPLVIGQTLYQPDEDGQLFAISRASLLTRAQHQAPPIPLPSGLLGRDILQGESLFMSHALTHGGLSCDSCHVAGGTATSYRQGVVIPSLLGAAATFPEVRGSHVRTLDNQINHCLTSMGAQPLSINDPRLETLNMYMHWLSSGWQINLESGTSAQTNLGGGCK